MYLAKYFTFIIFLILFSCGNKPDKKSPKEENGSYHTGVNIPGYDFNKPDEIITLPMVLQEVSGITATDRSTVACVQDENGIVFFFDIIQKKITRQITFYGDGDYEDIAMAGSRLYALRSDGLLLEITNLKASAVADEIPLPSITGYDNEGLCFDLKNNRLLIAPKNKPERDPGIEGERAIYGFDLKKREFIKKALYDFDLKELKKYALDNRVFPPEKDKKGKDKLPDIQFRPSAIAIHPVTGRIYILSSADPLLAVFNTPGKIEHIVRLDTRIFNMPEGMTFLSNGDILISNEGQGKNPTIIKIKYKPEG